MRPRLVFRITLVRFGFLLGRLTGPPRKRVVLATSHAAAITGNLAIIAEELAGRRPPIPTTVLAFRLGRGARELLAAPWHFLRSGFLLATSRLFVVDDYFMPMYAIAKRRGTTFVQVWHASGAFKKFGYSVLEKSFGASEKRVASLAIHTNYDLCLVSAMRFAPFYAEAFRTTLERFDASIGIPRTDVLFGDRRSAAEARLRTTLPIDGRRTILYAPTFRGDSILDARAPRALDLHVLRERLGDGYVVLLRQHPFVRDASPLDPGLADFALDVSDAPDIHELMLVSDMLVTDYSSAIFEYSLLRRPMAFFAPDSEAYERERGFYLDYASGLPGPLFESSEGLADWIRAGVFDLDRVEAFARESFDVADGHATERFIERVVIPALQ